MAEPANGRPPGDADEDAGPPREGPWSILKRTADGWMSDGAPQWGASIAFYSVVSLAPLVVLSVTLLGQVFQGAAVESRVLDQVRLLAGPRGEEVARIVLAEAGRPDMASLGAILTMGLLLFGATGVFANLQSALNRIWSVQPRSGVVRNLLRQRLAAFSVVLALGALMMVSVVVGTAVVWADPILGRLDALIPWVKVVDVGTSFFLLWLFVGTVYWVLPDVRISWKDVWIGAVVTAALLVAGRWALTAFLARNAFASMYGTAGSIFLLLIWIYYSAQVFFLGAEFTQVWATVRGRAIEPESYAVRVEQVTRVPGEDLES